MSGYSTPISNLSDITGESEYDRFYQKWEKVIKSGMDNDYITLNPYATKMLPKHDSRVATVKRLQEAVSELSKMPKS